MSRNNTEPYEQLISEEEVQAARQSRKDHERNQQQRNQNRPPKAAQDRPNGPACDYAEDPSDSPHLEDSMSPLLRFLLSFVSDRVPMTRGYRITMTGFVTGLCLAMGASYGAFERFGVTGFARADVLKSKIEGATHPLEEKINKQTRLLEAFSGQLTDQLASGTATEIREKTIKRCLEKSRSERDRLNGDIDRLQDRYFSYKQKYYEYRLTRYEDQECAEL